MNCLNKFCDTDRARSTGSEVVKLDISVVLRILLSIRLSGIEFLDLVEPLLDTTKALLDEV